MHEKIQAALEARGRFDFEYIPTGDNWVRPDERFAYKKEFPECLLNALTRTVLSVCSPVFLKLAYGAKVVGKSNLKALKKSGAICVCNHFSFLDTLFVRQAVGHFRSFHTMTERNNKRGIGGSIIRHGGMLPFSENYTASKNLINEMERLLQRGKIINFYAERAMWVNYRKPRPMKVGAFTCAVRFNVPVLPIFCTFELNKKRRIKRLRIHILPAVFPDKSLGRRERAESMRSAAQSSWKKCYEEAYGEELQPATTRLFTPAAAAPQPVSGALQS